MKTLKKNDVIEELAYKSGFVFDEHNPATRRKVELFAEQLIEICAQISEEQARVYTGENNEGAGCHRAAAVLRFFNTHKEI